MTSNSDHPADLWLMEELAKRGMSQLDLARKMDASPSEITKFKRGESSADMSIRIARALNVHHDEVLLLQGKITILARQLDHEAKEIGRIYQTLPEAKRQQLYNFARFLRGDAL